MGTPKYSERRGEGFTKDKSTTQTLRTARLCEERRGKVIKFSLGNRTEKERVPGSV